MQKYKNAEREAYMTGIFKTQNRNKMYILYIIGDECILDEPCVADHTTECESELDGSASCICDDAHKGPICASGLLVYDIKKSLALIDCNSDMDILVLLKYYNL